MSNTIQVIQFAENKTDETNKWYIDEQGRKVACNGDLIEAIWNDWIVSPGVYRSDSDGWTIFNFRELTTIEI